MCFKFNVFTLSNPNKAQPYGSLPRLYSVESQTILFPFSVTTAINLHNLLQNLNHTKHLVVLLKKFCGRSKDAGDLLRYLEVSVWKRNGMTDRDPSQILTRNFPVESRFQKKDGAAVKVHRQELLRKLPRKPVRMRVLTAAPPHLSVSLHLPLQPPPHHHSFVSTHICWWMSSFAANLFQVNPGHRCCHRACTQRLDTLSCDTYMVAQKHQHSVAVAFALTAPQRAEPDLL